MSPLPLSPSVQDMQKYVAEVERERGFAEQTPLQKCLLLGEEVGELFKAVRKFSDIRVDPNSSCHDVAEELADVLIFLIAIANRFEVDLTEAFLEKEAKNEIRTWI